MSKLHSKIHISAPPEIIDKDKEKEKELNKFYFNLFMKVTDFRNLKNELATVLVDAERKYDFDRHHNIYIGFTKCIKAKGWEDRL